jgi:hypothetical protein
VVLLVATVLQVMALRFAYLSWLKNTTSIRKQPQLLFKVLVMAVTTVLNTCKKLVLILLPLVTQKAVFIVNKVLTLTVSINTNKKQHYLPEFIALALYVKPLIVSIYQMHNYLSLMLTFSFLRH